MQKVPSLLLSTMLRGFIAGLTLSTAGSSATFTVAAGQATDSTNARLMTLAAAISKTTAAWAAGSGNGALDTGAIANNTWYHVHLIERTDGSGVDVLISLSATAPTMPAGYTFARRIGSMKTNGSGQWVAFVQDGDTFYWSTPVLDVSASAPGSAAITRTLSVPPSVRVEAFGSSRCSTAEYVLISDLALPDQAAGATYFTYISLGNQGTPWRCMTNTSGQVRTRLNDGTVGVLTMVTYGWTDPRGRNI